tara:strand:- start:5 stop:181 length:177 start_codon:yes stop_codon:yes gene_type:complete
VDSVALLAGGVALNHSVGALAEVPESESYGLEDREVKQVELIDNSLGWKQYPGFDTWG